MAPALSRTDRKPGSMEDHAMGLQNADSFLKDSQEMEQILGALDGGDILQVIKTMERAAGEPDAMFPLAAFERDFLADGETNEVEPGADRLARLATVQAGLERRCDFLHRRLRIQQARAAGKHVSEEVAHLFERAQLSSAPGSPPPPAASPAPLSRRGVRTLLQRLASGATLERGAAPSGLAHASAAQQCQLAIVEHHLDSDATLSSSGAESADEAIIYNNRQQQPLPLSKRALWKWSRRRAWIASRWSWLQAQVQELEYKLRQHAELQRQVTTSKGGPLLQEEEHNPVEGYSEPLPGESCARVRPLRREAFRKRRLLQMHNLHTTAAPKAAKPSDIRCICQWPLGGCAVCTGRALPAHPLPPACTLTQRQRIALVDPTFHPVLSTITDVSSSIHYSAMMSDPLWQQKSCRGAVKSLKGSNTKLPPAPPPPPSPPHNNITHYTHKKRKYNRLKRGRPSLAMMEQSRRRPSLMELEGGGGLGGSPPPSPSPDLNRYRKERNRLSSSYDIDNIVIPHSIAANTKLEILHYKEILTPKWRMVEPEESKSNNGLIRKSLQGEEQESDVEDISDASVLLRHERCEALERGKHQKKSRGGQGARSSRTGAGGRTAPPTPSQTPPHNTHTHMIVDETSRTSDGGAVSVGPLTAPPSPALTRPSTPDVAAAAVAKRRPTATDDIIELVAPYSPRTFPLSEETYNSLLEDMPANHPLRWCGATEEVQEPGDSYSDSHSPLPVPRGRGETLSDDDDDPNDPEWSANNTTDR